MIYLEPIVWRPGQSDVDRAFVDYIIDLNTNEITFARAALKPYVPTFGAGTITMTAPYGAFPSESDGVTILSRDGLFDEFGEPIEFTIANWIATGWAFMVPGNILYIVSDLFAHDYKLVCSSFGRYAKAEMSRKNLSQFLFSGAISNSTEETGGAAMYTDESFREKIAGSWPVGGDQIRIEYTDGNYVKYGSNFAAFDDNLFEAQLSGTQFSARLNLNETINNDGNGVLRDTILFSLGNFNFLNWGNIELANIVFSNYDYIFASWDAYFPNTPTIYDRSEFKNHLQLHTDSLEDTFVKIIDTEWRNSQVGYNTRTNIVTGLTEYIPARIVNENVDATGVALSDIAISRRKFVRYLLTDSVKFETFNVTEGEFFTTDGEFRVLEEV